jgi:tRNA pseudouridine55 synthase
MTSSSDDITGEQLTRHAAPLPEAAAVIGAAAGFIGRGLQTPPAISARKVEGQRLYKLARRGISVRAKATEVKIDRFELWRGDADDLYSFEARVSGGTYIRALVRDLGAKLGCGAVLSSLRRTAIGPMRPGPQADLGPEELKKVLIPLERMPLELSFLRLTSEEETRRFTQGGKLNAPPEAHSSGFCGVLSVDGALLGVAELQEGKLQPKVVLPPED